MTLFYVTKSQKTGTDIFRPGYINGQTGFYIDVRKNRFVSEVLHDCPAPQYVRPS